MSKLEALLIHHIKAMKLEMPVPEYRFHETRRWRFDFAYPEQHSCFTWLDGASFHQWDDHQFKSYQYD